MGFSSKKSDIVLIGAGNVATHLGKALLKAGFTIVQVCSKTESSAKKLAQKLKVTYTTEIKSVKKANIYIIAVNDDVVPDIINNLNVSSESIVVHTSGSVSINVFKDKFLNHGVFYPLQSFNKNINISFKNIPILIEACNTEILNVLEGIANELSKEVYMISSEERKVLHVAAVFVNNFSNYMYTVASDILAKHKLNFDLLVPLIQQTSHKLTNQLPENSQTGPAKRNDLKIINSHLEMLKSFPHYQKIYKLLTEDIQRRYN